MLRVTGKVLVLFALLIHSAASSDRSTKAYQQNKVRALVTAAAKGDARRVTELLKKGVDINGRAPREASRIGGQTALMAASVSGRLEVVRILLKAGADVNLRHEVGGTALTSATAQGHLEVVKELVAAHADPNVVVAGMHGPVYNVLMFAMQPKNKDWLKIVDVLIAAGAEVNPRGLFVLSPLRLIIENDDRSMLAGLIERGVNVNLRDEDGSTPLMYAARFGSPAMVNALVDAGAEINARNNKSETALIIARKYSAESVWGEHIVRVLRQRGGLE